MEKYLHKKINFYFKKGIDKIRRNKKNEIIQEY